MLKLTTDKHEASRGLSATAELLVLNEFSPSSRWHNKPLGPPTEKTNEYYGTTHTNNNCAYHELQYDCVVCSVCAVRKR